MVVYVDSGNKCHVADYGNMVAVEEAFFDGKCPSFIEGYCLEDVGSNRKIYPFVDSRILEAYQQQYEADTEEMADMKTALNTLGVTVNG